MPDTQALYARHRHPAGAFLRLGSGVQPDACLTVEAALASLVEIASRPSFGSSVSPGQDDVLAYALALMHLRDSAHAAGRARLTLACDALSVTVARLLDRSTQVHCEQCEALKHFVAHAQAMLRLPAEHTGLVRTH
ncbi:hypothetical protein [Acidovorax sp.]|uniref:hypothetical protein n=1 Tax=Acidovorax sp. TaxID=1872122 RepID=UPI000BD4F2F9|nr:hypothetical protein [Acidovorax sp.]OYW65712.1 MAG: hypothetical protein B7Z32_01990 [Hydrogenophilales bacterium 12-64-13]OYZ06652.1 MAG: hypothetical protein B7Y26_02290 [Hydrogenophilales bacterium 16-64-46]OZA39360.1 MAG: hypothetical protein B7X87_03395 [Hydrogenophilales bacterium 17-64-34]HQT01330.1 hypothetical protein [Thiobacillus sp.]